MKKVLYIANDSDFNDQLTFTVCIPKGTTRKDTQIFVLTAALEAAGWSGPFDGAGMDAEVGATD